MTTRRDEQQHEGKDGLSMGAAARHLGVPYWCIACLYEFGVFDWDRSVDEYRYDEDGVARIEEALRQSGFLEHTGFDFAAEQAAMQQELATLWADGIALVIDLDTLRGEGDEEENDYAALHAEPLSAVQQLPGEHDQSPSDFVYYEESLMEMLDETYWEECRLGAAIRAAEESDAEKDLYDPISRCRQSLASRSGL